MAGHILLQNNEIVKIQSLLRANKARDDYKTLGEWERSETRYGPSETRQGQAVSISGTSGGAPRAEDAHCVQAA